MKQPWEFLVVMESSQRLPISEALCLAMITYHHFRELRRVKSESEVVQVKSESEEEITGPGVLEDWEGELAFRLVVPQVGLVSYRRGGGGTEPRKIEKGTITGERAGGEGGNHTVGTSS